MEVSRRLFVGTVAAAGALAATVIPHPAAAATPRGLRITLYDPRFPGAREDALGRAAGGGVLPVGGDVTELLPQLLALRGAEPVLVQGITTESVPFCLGPALRAAGFAAGSPARLSRDLFHWQFHTRGVS